MPELPPILWGGTFLAPSSRFMPMMQKVIWNIMRTEVLCMMPETVRQTVHLNVLRLLTRNVIANMKEDIRETVYNNLTSRSYLEISFLKNLKFTANYSYDFTNSSQTVFYTPLIGDGQSFGGRGTKGSSTLRLPTSTRFWPTAMFLAITTTCRPR